jgi:hypothetical protein
MARWNQPVRADNGSSLKRRTNRFWKLSTACFDVVDRLELSWHRANIWLYLSTHQIMLIRLERLVSTGR